MRELSSLVGLDIIATDEGKKLGTVADVLVNLSAGNVVAVTLAETPELRVVVADDIQVIGPDAIMIASKDRLRSREEAAEALEHGRRVLVSRPSVITTRGARLGDLGTVYIDEGSLKVVRFEVSGGTFRDVTEGVLALPIMEGIVHGEDTIIVPHEVVARRLGHGGGLRGTFRSLAQKLRAGVEEVGERSEELLRESEERIKATAERAKKRAEELAEEARAKAEEAREAARETREKAKQAAAKAGEAEGEQPDVPDQAPQPQESEEPESTAIAPGPATPLPEHLEGGEAEAEEEEDLQYGDETPAAGDEATSDNNTQSE